jgi:ribosomal protein S18 acetylase RimI-like enzyme
VDIQAAAPPKLARRWMTASIRAAVAADLPLIADLIGAPDRAELRLRAAERGDEVMDVATLGEEVAGVVSVRWQAACDVPHPWLYGLYVASAHRRHGIGSALLEAGENRAREHGAGYVSLDVDQDNTGAVSFYRARGYVVVRGHVHHWRSIDPRTGEVTGTGSADTWIMRRPLG